MHGGGPQVTGHLDRLGIESEFTAGLRVTTEETIDVVRMVLNGKVNKDIVGLINRHGPYAVGLSGEDANLFTAERKYAIVDGAPVDIGLVGEIAEVDPSMVRALLDDGRIPVVSSVARGDGDGATSTTSTPTPPPPPSRSRSARPSWSCSPTSRASTGTGRTRTR